MGWVALGYPERLEPDRFGLVDQEAVEPFRAEAVEAAPAVEVVGGKDRTRGPLVTPKWHLMPPQEPAQNIVARCSGLALA